MVWRGVGRELKVVTERENFEPSSCLKKEKLGGVQGILSRGGERRTHSRARAGRRVAKKKKKKGEAKVFQRLGRNCLEAESAGEERRARKARHLCLCPFFPIMGNRKKISCFGKQTKKGGWAIGGC